MPPPEEHLQHLAAEAEKAKTQAYWKKNSLPTAGALIVCLVSSHFLAPLAPVPAVLFVLAGLLTERGATLYERGRFELGLAVQAAGMLLGGYMLFNIELSLFGLWVQAIGLFFLGLFCFAAVQQLIARFRQLVT
jgi:hypothetical protein